ncbi:hypothetical protein GCK32_012770 [Trichostrongylus colubriformis]|uniref:Serpentine receptor class gamma n=1 Tax=Trichostrongylus colubriformis TaxID=6319 RepID=A0AAN8FRT8_TRICO
MLIAINRFCAVCLKKNYDKIWTRKNVRIMIGLQYACAFAASTPAIGAELIYFQNSDGTYTFMGMDRRNDLINRCTYVGTCLTYVVITLFLNVRLLLELHKLLKLSESGKHIRHERGMLFCTILVFAFTTLMCAQQIARGIATLTESSAFLTWITVQYYWINDAMVSVAPFSLLLLNAELRRDISNFFRCQRYNHSVTISVSNFKNRQSTSDLNSHCDRRNAGRSIINKY